MARVKRGVTSHAKHKKILKSAKGFYGRRKNTIRAAKGAVDRAMQYAATITMPAESHRDTSLVGQPAQGARQSCAARWWGKCRLRSEGTSGNNASEPRRTSEQ